MNLKVVYSINYLGVSTRGPPFLLLAFGWAHGPLVSVKVGSGHAAPSPGRSGGVSGRRPEGANFRLTLRLAILFCLLR